MQNSNKSPPMKIYLQDKIADCQHHIKIYKELADENPSDNGYYLYMISVYKRKLEDYQDKLKQLE